MAESQDATLLQRRARRRLVGAIALVVLVVIVLPIVLDTEPSPVGQDLVVQIPSREAGKFNTRVLTPSAPGAATPPLAGAEVAAPAKSEALTPGTVPKDASTAASAKDQTRVAKDESDAARAKALLEGKEAWVVRLGAFSNQANVKKLRDKLTEAGVKSYTEAAIGPKGEQTRVRAGPFDSKFEADEAQKKLTAAGVSAGTVGPR